MLKNWQGNVWWVCLAVFLSQAGFNFAYPILPFYLMDYYGLTEQVRRDFYIGSFALAGNFGFLIFSPLWGRLADLFGKRMMMIRANGCMMVLLPLIGFMPSPDALVVLRFVIGVFGGVVVAAMTLVACSTPANRRGSSMGMVSSSMFCGSLSGMVLGGFCAGELGYRLTFLLCGVLLGGATAISIWLVREEVTPPPAGTRILPKFELPRFGRYWYLMLLMVATGCVQQMDGPYLPVLVNLVLDSGSRIAMRWNGILGGACAAAGIFGGYLIGRCCDRYPGERVGMTAAVAAGLLVIPQALVTNLPLLFCERVTMTFFVSGFSPVAQIWVALAVPEEQRGSYLGYSVSFRCIGWLISGLLAVGVTTLFGTRAVFAVVGILMFGLAWAIWRISGAIPFPNARATARHTKSAESAGS